MLFLITLFRTHGHGVVDDYLSSAQSGFRAGRSCEDIFMGTSLVDS